MIKLIWENEERGRFWQWCYHNSKKKYERGERNDVMEGESERERQLNFGDVVVEISAQNASCLGGVRREKKKWIVASIATHQAKFWIIVIVLIKMIIHTINFFIQ